MSSAEALPTRRTRPWVWMILILVVLRLPSLAEPVGNDQNLYLYVADEVRHGGVPYVDAWDQKPPGIDFLYAALRTVWPHPSVVAGADLVAAALGAWLLVRLGRKLGDPVAGGLAGVLSLLFGDPAIQRVGGVYVRGQCEAFIALAATAAIVLLTGDRRRMWAAVLAGVLLGAAFWLKYNAIAYALPLVMLAAWPAGRKTEQAGASFRDSVAAGAGGFTIVSAIVLLYFAVHHALLPLWQSSVLYNLAYSGETYGAGFLAPVRYVLTMPIGHARIDMLWFLGVAGAVPAIAFARRARAKPSLLPVVWLAAAIGSIAINGARELPQYFVQAHAPLALTAATGALGLLRRGWIARTSVVLVVALGLIRVGVEAPVAGFRWGGLPQLVDNLRFDSLRLAGRLDEATYLGRFRGGQKFDALANAGLTHYVEATTAPTDRILVFGFAPGVYVESGRKSASRFFWSRPVIYGFAANQPDYGPAGLLRDLLRTPPALVALQRRDWFPDVPNSLDFFMGNAALRAWLTDHYVSDRDDGTFSVWRRRT